MAREWSLRTVANLKFRELEKTIIEVFGCIPVDYKRVIKLDVRRQTPMVPPEVTLGTQEKSLVETFGCLHDKHVIDFDAARKNNVIIKVVHDEGEFAHPAPLRLIV
ncbi:MAG: hypothetical protein ACYDHW_08500 [Syntrophorhabdaceae bacterium]